MVVIYESAMFKSIGRRFVLLRAGLKLYVSYVQAVKRKQNI